MIKEIKCKQTVPGQFIEGTTYPVDTEYDTHIIVRDLSGSFHHLKKDGEFLANNFSL
ncbi:hypothetical protein [Paenibacillus anaericanus]|uniref:hypothetical protein n=1 Tax=Paenibacillus anaericanus TaxID=170367 RepID=UPI001476A050|nr:hypothetical protein [Paenibacillus anaericanus]